MSTAEPATARTTTREESAWDLVPSPILLLLLGATALGGWLAWNRTEYSAFLLVLAGWIVSLAAHEYAHAVLAYRFGDRALRGQGYLTLNPLRYREMFAGFLMPVLFLLLGGFGMTGPTVYVDYSTIGGRAKRSLVAAVGPLVNLALAAGLVTVVTRVLAGQVTDSWFWAAIILLSYLQLTAAAINLLPVPGLDGFAVIAPYLPRALRGRSYTAEIFGVVAMFALAWFPPVNELLEEAMFRLLLWLDVNPLLFGLGQSVFAFWAG